MKDEILTQNLKDHFNDIFEIGEEGISKPESRIEGNYLNCNPQKQRDESLKNKLSLRIN